MAILGLTHSAEGAALQRLPVAIKVSIGRGPDPAKGQKHPQRLDHFEFLQKVNRGQDVVWDPDPEVTKAMQEIYGKDPREIGIVLLDDDPENVFRTSYAMWTNTECKCRGELVQINGQFSMQAIRKTEKHPEGEPWPGGYKYSQGDKKGQPAEPCGDGCPDLEEGRCKVQGDLHFILEKFPTFGAVCRLHTTSYRSIRNISNALQQIRSITGGRLGGIRVTLTVAPEKIAYAGEDGKKHSSTAYILGINLAAETVPKLLEKMTEFAKMFQDTRKLLGGHRVEVIEDEDERAPEIASEFYPAEETRALPEAAPESKVAGPPRAEIPQSYDDVPSRVRQPERASAAPAAVPAQATLITDRPAAAKKPNGANGKPALVSQEQRISLFKACVEAGWSNEQVSSILRDEFGFNGTKDITVDKFDAIFKRFTLPVEEEREPGSEEPSDQELFDASR